MSTEALNTRTHDSGFLRWDWTYWTDQSVDDGYASLKAHGQDGIDQAELVAFLKSAGDHDELTDREARQIANTLRVHYHQMDATARQTADAFDAKLVSLLPDVHDCSHEKLAGYKYGSGFGFTPIGVRSGYPDRAILAGEELRSALWYAEQWPAIKALKERG